MFDVTEGDSDVQTRSLHVGTDKAPPSDLHFRLCFRGNAAWNTDYRVREHDGSQWAAASLASGCLNSSIGAGRPHREIRIDILGDACPEGEGEQVNWS